ncbi:MAG: hypothetical protein V3V74_07210 [Nitrosomonadaceae bacterium]
MTLFSQISKTIPSEEATKIANEALITITSEAKKEKVGLDQLSTLALITFILSIKPNINRLIEEKGRQAVLAYLTGQLASLDVAKITLVDIIDNISKGEVTR